MNNEFGITTKKSFAARITLFISALFLFAGIFMPNDSYSIKKILLALLFILTILTCGNLIGSSRTKLLNFFSLILPTTIIVFSSILTGEPLKVFSRSYFMYMPLIVVVLLKFKIDYKRLFINGLFCLACFIVFNGLLDFIGILDIYNNPLLMFFSSTKDAMIGKSESHVFFYVIFFKASPLIILAFLYYLDKRKIIKVIICLIAIILSGTRANVFITVIALYVFIFLKSKKNSKIFIVAITLIGLLMTSAIIFDFVSNVFGMKADSDAVRAGHLTSILNVFKGNPWAIFFGTGIGSEFYSLGINGFTDIVELSYWDLWRQIGIIGLLMFFICILYPIKKIYAKSRMWIVVGGLAYLIIAYTNPLLFSTTSYLLYILIYYEYYQRHNKRRNYRLFI